MHQMDSSRKIIGHDDDDSVKVTVPILPPKDGAGEITNNKPTSKMFNKLGKLNGKNRSEL